MIRNMLIGAAAGAVGTVVLDASTYTDMAVRGRAPSAMTQTVVQKLAEKAGLQPLGSAEPDEPTKNRQTAVGSLLGYVTGVGVGLVYGAIRPAVRDRIPLLLAGVVAGAAAMALTDVTATALGATDPAQWDESSWLSDIVPHLAYGLATALSFEQLTA